MSLFHVVPEHFPVEFSVRGCFDADVEGKPRVVEVAEVVLGEYIRHEGHGVDPFEMAVGAV